jgi:omega-6 fatty acid desaturase (delta-12 desaturase)
MVHTLVTVRLFVQFHDMAHYSFFSSMTMNKIIGKILGVYVHFPFDSWRKGHNHHHKHFGNLDRLDLSQTILFTKKQY